MNTDIGARQFFFDGDAVEAGRNVRRTVCQASKHASNPVLPLGRADQWDAMQARPWVQPMPPG